jgi:hypothetical protein
MVSDAEVDHVDVSFSRRGYQNQKQQMISSNRSAKITTEFFLTTNFARARGVDFRALSELPILSLSFPFLFLSEENAAMMSRWQ